MITQAELKERYEYDKYTGLFTSRMGRNKGRTVGSIKADGYRYLSIYRRNYKNARIAWLYMTGEYPTQQIQHINGIYDDDRWINLRHADQTVNSIMSAPRRKVGASGHRGVTQLVGGRYWAKIRVDGRDISLGTYVTAEEAAAMYEVAEKMYFGDLRG